MVRQGPKSLLRRYAEVISKSMAQFEGYGTQGMKSRLLQWSLHPETGLLKQGLYRRNFPEGEHGFMGSGDLQYLDARLAEI